jgi:hypothetical protein
VKNPPTTLSFFGELELSTDKTKQNKTKQNKTKQNKTKQNKTKQNKTKQNKTKQNKTRRFYATDTCSYLEAHGATASNMLLFHSNAASAFCWAYEKVAGDGGMKAFSDDPTSTTPCATAYCGYGNTVTKTHHVFLCL